MQNIQTSGMNKTAYTSPSSPVEMNFLVLSAVEYPALSVAAVSNRLNTIANGPVNWKFASGSLPVVFKFIEIYYLKKLRNVQIQNY